ncbi:MAG: alkaline phosphatase family protein [Acidobacteriota bacterium]|nr:alkaline phosphatase family protein [Acidobacteriota bacterium]
MKRTGTWILPFALLALAVQADDRPAAGQSGPHRPRVIVVGVNGAELDIIRPLLVRGEMPNLKKVIDNGVSGRLKTVGAPNCPKVYTTFATSAPPEEHGITGFLVGGITANTHMLKREPFWSILSKQGVTVGMANVPATFPVMPVNGYMVSGMLTRGKGCEDGVLCAPKLSEVQGGDAVYPKEMVAELEANVGDFLIDCSRMPSSAQINGNEAKVVHEWLAGVQKIRDQQMKLFDYLLSKHPTDFTMMVQSCEDRVGHWLYPIQPFHAGYNPKVANVDVDAFPAQYRAFDRVLGTILKHVDENTTLLIISDHGIKPLRYTEPPHAHMDHAGTTPVIAKHDYEDGDEVPGAFFAMGPGIKKGVQFYGMPFSVYDIAPTVLHLYGINAPAQMKGRFLTEIFEGSPDKNAVKAAIVH